MITSDYQCEGQMNIWEYMYQVESKPKPEPKQEPDDSVCEGCKWREHDKRWLEVDEYGQTWVHACPGTACANWTSGTPLNITTEKPSKEETVWYLPEPKPYCFNRDFLPDLEWIVNWLMEWTGLKFTYFEDKFKGEVYAKGYRHKFKGSDVEIDEGTYAGSHKRFVGVSWEGKLQGTSAPCDNLDEILRAVERAIERSKNE